MAFRYFVALIVLSSPLMIHAYSKGAPVGACDDMVPQHHVDPQSTKAPYDFIISKSTIKAGDTVQITIKGKSAENKIKGLLVQARVGNQPIGKFSIPSNNPYVQTIDCGNGSFVSIFLCCPLTISYFFVIYMIYTYAILHERHDLFFSV